MPDNLPSGMVFEDFSLRLSGEGYASGQDPVRYFGGAPYGLPVWPPEESVAPGFHVSEKVWNSGEPEPEDFAAPTFLDSISLAGVALGSLARHEVTKLTIGEEEIENASFRRMKWRFAWQVPASAAAWRFVHLRWKLKLWYTVSTDPEPVEVSVGPTVDFWWKGEVPEGYDAGDPVTYPGTPWVEIALPVAPVTPADSTAANFVRLAWVWPTPEWVEENGTKLAGAFQYPGFIPGMLGPVGRYAKPLARTSLVGP
jgi:hypothetical protein